MKISTTKEFRDICPEFIGAAISATVKNDPTPQPLWSEIENFCAELKEKYTTENIKLHSGINATRKAYKRFGKDPSRYRPACEQLARRVLQGKGLYSVDTLVDLGNLVSLFCGYSTAALDYEKIVGDSLTLGIGQPEEPYEGIGRGLLNIEHLPVYRDCIGGVATPTSDNVRTMISAQTQQLVVLINAYDGNKSLLDQAVNLTIRLLQEYAAANDVCVSYY
ncbi:MAG: hypothetical protein IKB97_09650 [Bacteroidaceae bacterium]|nr:hypothetical protein [Bacteroidaceae bacterium]